MKGTISAAEAHRQYSEGMTAFRRQIADQALRDRFAREADTFFRACALGLWQRDGASLSPRHVEFYNAIYTKGNPVPSVLFWELSGQSGALGAVLGAVLGGGPVPWLPTAGVFQPDAGL